jgi:hypothetical protein
MGVLLNKKSITPPPQEAPPWPEGQNHLVQSQSPPQQAQAQAQPSPQQPKPGSFLKTGKQAQETLEKEQARADARREANSRAFRFFISEKNVGGDFPVIFLDGDLGPDGTLELTTWEEHFVRVAGKPQQYVCLKHSGPPGAESYCPMCADDEAAVIAAFSVLDLTPYTVKNNQNQGKVIPVTKKLYAAKRGTLAHLQKLAVKYGGLRGLQVDVSRTTKNAAAVGDQFLPGKKWTLQEIKEKFGRVKDMKGNPTDEWYADPLNYAEEAPYLALEDLQKLGIAGTTGVIGSQAQVGSMAALDKVL